MTTPKEPSRDKPATDEGFSDTVLARLRAKLEQWKKELLDTSKANPLLRSDHGRSVRVSIVEPKAQALYALLVDERQDLELPFVERLPVKKSEDGSEEATAGKLKLHPSDDLEFEPVEPGKLRTRLRRLYDGASSSIEERGVQTLFIGFGFLRWSDAYYEDAVSPLVLVPCEVEKRGPRQHPLLRMTDGDIALNGTLKEVLKKQHEIELPDLSLEDEPDANKLATYFKEVQKAVQPAGFSVSPDEARIGLFSFANHALHKDLDSASIELLANNPVIVGLAGIASKENMGDDYAEETLDGLDSPEVVPIPVIDTDSSQLSAITSVANGQSVVIHGPPGTGKSQTITNIIATLLGKGKRVLFVSSKTAALDVVYRNLSKVGLGSYCLEAHSAKAGKKVVIEDLKRCVENVAYAAEASDVSEELEDLIASRDHLNKLAAEINVSRGAYEISIYQALGEYSRFVDEQAVACSMPWETPLLEVTKRDFEDTVHALEAADSLGPLFKNRSLHPLRGLEKESLTIPELESLQAGIRLLIASAERQSLWAKSAQGILGDSNQLSLGILAQVAPLLKDIAQQRKFPKKWNALKPTELEGMAELFSSAADKSSKYRELLSAYKLGAILSHREASETWPDELEHFKGFGWLLHPIEYSRWKNTKSSEVSGSVSVPKIRQLLEKARALVRTEKWLEQNADSLEVMIDEPLLAVAPDFARAANAARAMKDLLTVYHQSGAKAGGLALLDEMCQGAASALVAEYADNGSALKEHAERLDKLWSRGFVEESSVFNAPLVGLIERLKEVQTGADSTNDWFRIYRALARCNNLNLQPFLAEPVSGSLSKTFQRRFWLLWLDEAISSQGHLGLSGLEREELRRKFLSLDDRVRSLQKNNTVASLAEIAGQVSLSHGAHAGGELATLRREFAKTRRIKPLRKLFTEIPTILSRLKPCFMMSPVSVSTYLSRGNAGQFDVVVFDEASQVRTAEAIPAILRSKQVVIAGDENQLPPSDFFEADMLSFGEDVEVDEEQEQLVSLDSLLGDSVATVGTFRDRKLLWHYRSRDERLIKFSNYFFYENRLITFPSPNADGIGQGIRYEYVENGIWDRGVSRTNRIEARRVAELAIEHFEQRPDLSLGIVALNASQREAIEDAIEDALRSKPGLAGIKDDDHGRGEKAFVKSLENVQGDERDVMIISTGYGVDKDGAFSHNFGPINQRGGWKRLNVLVTRARWQTVLVTSMQSHRIDAGQAAQNFSNSSGGMKALRDFLAYAERNGELPTEAARPVSGETNDFEDTVTAAIKRMGYLVDQQVGASIFRIDIAVRDPRNPDSYLLGIECDGVSYHSSRTARDRDCVREQVLRGMGWKIHRLWGTDWYRNRKVTEQAIADAIQTALLSPKEESVARAAEPDEPVATKPQNPAQQAPPKTRPLRSLKYPAGLPYAKYTEHHNKSTLTDDSRQRRLSDIIYEIIRKEGPIHEDLLLTRIREAFGVGRIGSKIEARIGYCLRQLADMLDANIHRPFFGVKNQETIFRIPSADMKRQVSEIHGKEIAVCILHLVELNFGMAPDAIPAAVASTFEDGKLDDDERVTILQVVDELIADGRLIRTDEHVSIAA